MALDEAVDDLKEMFEFEDEGTVTTAKEQYT
jgi:hypothetical protein